MTTETLTDRELDAWLSEHLFGCRTTETTIDIICGCGLGVEGVDQRWPVGEHWKDTESYVPQFASTGDGMLLVLSEMRERGWVGMVKWDGARDHAWFTALFSNPAEVRRIDAETLPRAVAEAAKAALSA